jgi:polysaccharide pyruvyl transferase WcaK-like protein
VVRIAIVADLGQRAYHVGDEAIGLAAARQLAQRGAEVSLVAHDPRLIDPALRQHPVLSMPAIPWDPSERLALLAAVRQGSRTRAGRRAFSDPGIAALREGLRTVDRVHIAGGGNHTSLYGWLLIERAIVVALAESLDLPVTLSGQTFGPSLHAGDRAALADELRSLWSLTTRDRASAALATRLLGSDSTVRSGLDDATFVTGTPATDVAPDHISATFSQEYVNRLGSDAERLLGRQLDALSATVGLPVRFESHVEERGMLSGDGALHRRIAEHMAADRVIIDPIRSVDEVVGGMSSAALVVTSRFHPVVFACAAAVPALVLGGTHYANVRLDGVLDSWGLDGFRAREATVLDGRMTDRAEQLLAHGAIIRAHLAAQRGARRHQWDQGWDAVLALDPATGSPPALPPRLEAPWGPSTSSELLADRLEAERERLVVDLDLATSSARFGRGGSRARRFFRL